MKYKNHIKFQKALLAWFDQHGRKDLPWQNNTTPYRVWLSEIMLQQTQVRTVIPYFEKFTTCFPTIQQLAQAPQDEVLHLWSGLGYYSRARNLHKTAQIITQKHQGKFPDSLEALCELPGIGCSTAGAILSIAMGKPTPILDGNVKRVLTRYRAIHGWPGNAQVLKALWDLAERLTPQQRAADYTQAIMDLGATVCTRTKPNCPACPLSKDCMAYAQGNPTAYPEKRAKKPIPTKDTIMLLITCKKTQRILLEKRPPTGIWAGLWSLPQCDSDVDVPAHCREHYGFSPQTITQGKAFKHRFTHFHLNIQPMSIITPNRQNNNTLLMENTQRLWYNINRPQAIGLPRPVSRIIGSMVT